MNKKSLALVLLLALFAQLSVLAIGFTVSTDSGSPILDSSNSIQDMTVTVDLEGASNILDINPEFAGQELFFTIKINKKCKRLISIANNAANTDNNFGSIKIGEDGTITPATFSIALTSKGAKKASKLEAKGKLKSCKIKIKSELLEEQKPTIGSDVKFASKSFITIGKV